LRPTIARDILTADNPPVRMIWVTSSNIVNQAPDSRAIAQAFQKVEFKVVVEAFMTDTAERADLILPAALSLEREDLVGAAGHDYINYAAQVFTPPGEAKSDHQILTALGQRLDPPLAVPSTEEIFRTSLQSPYLDVTLEELRAKGFVRALRPEIAFEGLRFAHPDGKHCFPERLHPEPAPPREYPLRLLSLIRRRFMHSQIFPQDQSLPSLVRLSPDSPAWAGIDLSRQVYLASPLGRMPVRPEKMEGLHPGVVLYRRGDWMKLGGGVNRIISPEMTDLGQGAAFYSQHVRIEN
jgi:anaerobic selenocysteine-containing dehydrogenase